MAITTAMATSFKKELFEGLHNFLLSGGNTFKLALYTSSATLGASTTTYSATDEVSGTGYSAGGHALTRIDPANDGTAGIVDFADLVISTATITARGCLIYNDTNGDRACSTHNFGSNKTATAGDFTLIMPAAAAATAILRIA